MGKRGCRENKGKRNKGGGFNLWAEHRERKAVPPLHQQNRTACSQTENADLSQESNIFLSPNILLSLCVL